MGKNILTQKTKLQSLILTIIVTILFIQVQFKLFDTNSLASSERLQDFVTLFLGIIVEAFPFVVFGTLVSVIVALYVNEEWIFKKLPKSRFLSHFSISFIGMFMPVCECGNVPVSRRLMLKGFSVSQSITFLLAAPILNPITLFSTWKAFEPDSSFVIARFLSAIIIANIVGLVFSYKKDQSELITEKFNAKCQHDHTHGKSKLEKASNIFREEFLGVMKMLVFGAVLASIIRSFFPSDVITSIGENAFLSVIAMLLFAFTISICSNVDAFVILGYANTFTAGSILTFLVFGPMIDIKILSMLRTTFRVKTLFILVVLVSLLSLIAGLSFNYIK